MKLRVSGRMSKDFHEAYEQEEVGPPPERSTGIVFAVVSAIVGYFLRDSMTALAICGLLSFGFLVTALFMPKLLGPLNIVWFKFSLLLHKVMNPVILGLMFLVAIVPFGLVMRAVRDPMRSKKTDGPTYWIEREPKAPETHSMTNQF